MDAVKYFKEKNRMLSSLGGTGIGCNGVECMTCPLSSNINDEDLSCTSLESEKPEIAVEIIEKWSEEHPRKTILEDFLEKHPSAPLTDDGVPVMGCPRHI